jgi:hypothetical protein
MTQYSSVHLFPNLTNSQHTIAHSAAGQYTATHYRLQDRPGITDILKQEILI